MKISRQRLAMLTILLAITSALRPLMGPVPALASTGPHHNAPSPVSTQPPGPDGDPLPAPLGVDEGILVDASTGAVLWQVNDTVPRPPASLTKIATAMVVLQRANLNQIATVTPDAAAVGGSVTYAPAGATMTVEDMLWGLLMVSGNDMAVALAHAVSPDGSISGFATLMNQDAAAIGASGTTFVNPHGLDAPGHVSTARDLALLTMVDMQNPTFAQIVGTRQHSVAWEGVSHPMTNHNKLLELYPGTIGVKTGYTDGAGNALISEATRNGATLLSVVMGTKSPAGYADSEALYNWGFANLSALEAQSTDRLTPKPLPRVAPAAQPAPAKDTTPRQAAGEAGSSVGRDVVAHHSSVLNQALMLLLAASFVAAVFLTRRRPLRPARR